MKDETKCNLCFFNPLRFSLLLHSFSFMVKKLTLNCEDRADYLLDLLEKCTQFYKFKYCLFTCPNQCRFDERRGETIWLTGPFKYILANLVIGAIFEYHLLCEAQTVYARRPIIQTCFKSISSLRQTMAFCSSIMKHQQ